MCTVRQITYSCPVVPIHSNNVAQPKKQKLQAQISYPNQFATVIVTSTGALIAALKAREVEKVSQGCPFNRIGLVTRT
jgi:maleate cis-trans isomerase